jgi:CheY-like chemotaxis protein
MSQPSGRFPAHREFRNGEGTVILFIDDEPSKIQYYVEVLAAKGLAIRLLQSVAEINAYLAEPGLTPTCIVLDVMFPADPELPGGMTYKGLTTGMLLFASLRAHFPSVHIVVLTNSSDIAVKAFFQSQSKCSFFYKTEMLPTELATVIEGIVTDRGSDLLKRFLSCKPGHEDARVFEALCVDILEYLFVPPLKRVVAQSARSDGHAIRDAVLPNNATGYFWDSLRRELDAKHVVVEFKNYISAVGKDEVIQLRQYLTRKSIGRFGLLVSRLPPSESALTARADAYGEQGCLILFVDDDTIRKMIDTRRNGGNPALILQQMKEEFEVEY